MNTPRGHYEKCDQTTHLALPSAQRIKLRLRNVRLDMLTSNARVVVLKLRFSRQIEIGFDTYIGPHCKIIIGKGAKVRVRGANFSRAVTIDAAPNALLEIGRSFIGPGSIISAQEHIRIGNASLLADYVTIRDQNHLHNREVPLSAWRYVTAPVFIGDDVWIASKATVVAGVVIADHALCAAGAVVTKNVESWQKVGGVPARPLGSQTDKDSCS